MDFNETFENIKNKAAVAAQAAAGKAKNLAQISKANIDIRAEQDKQKKAYTELGKLFYRDFITGEESDEAEYLPWCDKVTESVRKVNELRELIDSLKAKDKPEAEEAAETEEAVEAEQAAEPVKTSTVGFKLNGIITSVKDKIAAAANKVGESASRKTEDPCDYGDDVEEAAFECADEVKEDVCECAEEVKEEVCKCAEEIKPEE